jgi:hypothetical protein
MNSHRQQAIAVLLLLLALQTVTGIRVVEASGLYATFENTQEDYSTPGLVGHCFVLHAYPCLVHLPDPIGITPFRQPDIFGVTYRRPPPFS